jgi:Secretion system C-terminal sorting domain
VPVDSVILSWVPVLDTVYYRGHSLDQGYAMNSVLDSLDRIIFQWSAGEYFNPQYALESFVLITDSNLWQNSVFKVFAPLSSLPQSAIPSISQNLSVASNSSILCTDTLAVWKHNSITLSSVQDYWPGHWGYQQYPCVANVENTAVFNASGAQDSVWANRSADNENDDLPYIKQSKNVALEMYWPLPKSPLLGVSNPTVGLHWRDQDFSEIRNDSLWLLGRVDNNYVAVRRAGIGVVNGVRAYRTTNPPGQTWVIIVGDSIMYGSFNNFQTVVDSAQLTETWRYDSTAQQEIYYAKVVIDGQTIEHAWTRDSSLSTGISALRADASGLAIYPNPANTAINIAMDNIQEAQSIEVYNMLGELVYEASVNDRKITVATAQWTDGLYAVRVKTNAGVISKAFAISH